MLVLTRREGEKFSLYIPPKNDVTQVDIVTLRIGRQVRIGIDAPQDVCILREEVPDDGRVAAMKEGCK